MPSESSRPTRAGGLVAPPGVFSRILEPLRRAEASYLLLIVTVGIIGGMVGLLYRLAVRLFQVVYFASNENILVIAQGLPWAIRLVAPAGGALVAALIIRYGLRGPKGEGMSEIMEAVVLREKVLKVRSALWKGLSTMVAIGSGSSVGREGPIVQISASSAGRIAGWVRVSAERRRILIGCGTAAGMAAAYNAPIGASLFVMEVIIGNFAMEIFGPLVISSVVATLVTRGVVGGAIYETPGFQLVSSWEFLIFLLMGVACAVVGRLFIELLNGTGKLFRSLRIPYPLSATLGGLGIGAVAIWVPYVWGNGYEGVDMTLKGEIPFQLFGWILAGKMVATALSIGSGLSGGVFTPTIFVGASLGALIGGGAHALWPDLTSQPGAYALVGMSGLLAATTHAPIMSTLMVFEMSLNYNLILPVLVCTGISALISRAIKKESIYTERLRRRGVDIDLAIEQTALQSIHVEEVMWTSPPTIRPDATLRALIDKFLHMRGGDMIHVVERDGRYVGIIDVQDLMAAADQKGLGDILIAGDLARVAPHVTVGDPVSAVTEKFWFNDHGQLPVLSRDDPPRFLGVVTRRDVLRSFDREVLQRKLLAVRYAPGEEEPVQRRSTVDLPADCTIEELPVPASLAGRTLMDLDLPHSFLLTVLSLKPSGGGPELIPPPSDAKLSPGDRLVLVGKRPDLLRFARQ